MAQFTKRTLHVRVAGRSAELDMADLGLLDEATDSQIKDAVVSHLDLPAQDLATHVVVRTSQAIIVRPEAIYG